MPRALILKLGSIGDVCMTIPAAHALHQQGYTVDWAASPSSASILRLYPWLNVIEVDEAKILRGSLLERLTNILKLWSALPTKRYDLCATLYFDPRYRFLALPVRAPRKIRLSKTDRAFALLPGRHHADEYARILLNRPDDHTTQQIAPVRPATLPENPVPRTTRKPRTVLVPGGARNLLRDDLLRRWPIESYVAVATALLARGHEVILSGGPDDRWVSEHFTHLAVTDAIAQHSLPQTLALFDSADAVCTHDTGPLHLAGLTRCAIVTIFGPVDPHGRLPQRHDAVALWGGEGFACRPCYDAHDYAACTNNLCMQQITPTMVVSQLESLLLARREGRPTLPRIRVPKHTPIQLVSRTTNH